MRVTLIRLLAAATLLAGVAPADAQVPRRREAPTVSPGDAAKEREHKAPPQMDDAAQPQIFNRNLFRPGPVYPPDSYDVDAQIAIYGGKRAVETPRPLLELGYRQYSEGPLGAGFDLVGRRNLVRPQLLAYGDLRTAAAYNDQGARETGQVATRINLDIDLKLTATERVHAFFRPLDNGRRFSRVEFAGGNSGGGELLLDGKPETFFFEGDLGAIQTGLFDKNASYDLPFTVGLIPLFFQNGIWVDDAFVGGAATITAKNSRLLDVSNFDITVFAGFDNVDTTALRKADGLLDDRSADIYGAVLFADTRGGHLEAGYGYLDDKRDRGGLSYHSAVAGWTRRYGSLLSNSVRLVGSFGQNPDNGARQTADGFALLVENSLVTSLPSTLVPYANFFVGRDRPQPLARGNQGLLKNTGINFETDGLTGFPLLNDTAQDAWGGAIGVSYLFDLSRQVVFEVATVQPFGGASDTIRGDESAIGVRFQQNLTQAVLIRFDAIMGFRDNADNVSGVRMELRRKF